MQHGLLEPPGGWWAARGASSASLHGAPFALPAGVAVGLVTDNAWSGAAQELAPAPVDASAAAAPVGRYELLTDLQGLEDQLGDMDLKVAGGCRATQRTQQAVAQEHQIWGFGAEKRALAGETWCHARAPIACGSRLP